MDIFLESLLKEKTIMKEMFVCLHTCIYMGMYLKSQT